MENSFDDTYFMKKALQEAELAYEKGEIPIGAIIVIDNRIIARAHNLTEKLNDVTAHAEMQAITAAANFLGGKYLNQLYAICDFRTLPNVCWSSLLESNIQNCLWS